MSETADVIVVGAGVQGASLAFHLAERGASVLVVDRRTVAAEATGRSSGFVRMHYDLESDARLAWASYPYFADWGARVGHGDCGFVRSGFVQLVAGHHVASLRANVAVQQRLGIRTDVIGHADLAALVPGMLVDDIGAAAYEPDSGFADPTGTAAGFMAAARAVGARLVQQRRVDAVLTERGRVTGVATSDGIISAPVVVDVGGAWAAELARTVGVEVPIQAWRHDTAYFGLPPGRTARFPVVIDDVNGVYFRPEGTELVLVGLDDVNEIGGSPDRPMHAVASDVVERMVERICIRLPWMSQGTLRTAHSGQDGITPDQRPVLGAAGPDGFYLACGFSGTGFKTAPAIGASLAELIMEGRSRTADLTPYALGRFAEGRLLVGEHPYPDRWR